MNFASYKRYCQFSQKKKLGHSVNHLFLHTRFNLVAIFIQLHSSKYFHNLVIYNTKMSTYLYVRQIEYAQIPNTNSMMDRSEAGIESLFHVFKREVLQYFFFIILKIRIIEVYLLKYILKATSYINDLSQTNILQSIKYYGTLSIYEWSMPEYRNFMINLCDAA